MVADAALRSADVQVQQARERQIDVADFIERHRLVDTAERAQLRLA